VACKKGETYLGCVRLFESHYTSLTHSFTKHKVDRFSRHLHDSSFAVGFLKVILGETVNGSSTL
jgi:hypothetical protein